MATQIVGTCMLWEVSQLQQSPCFASLHMSVLGRLYSSTPRSGQLVLQGS